MKIRALLLLCAGLFFVAACNNVAGDVVATYEPPDIHALQLRTFESLWGVIDENYVYPTLQGTDWDAIRDEYLALLDDELGRDEFGQLMEQMTAELPSGTVAYQTRADRIEQAARDLSSYEGIGSFVTVRREPEPRIVLLQVMPGSPSEQAGLQAHDAILAIDGSPILEDEVDDPISRVRGPSGTDVIFTVRSPGAEPREVTVTRGQIARVDENRLQTASLPEARVGYFLFPPANYEQLVEDFALGLQRLATTSGLEAIILDLRIVTSGESWPAGTLLSFFVDGEIGATYTRDGTTPLTVEGIDDFLDTQSLPLAVLVGPDTSGTPEAFAAVMQTTDRAIVLGSQTPGNVEQLTPFNMPDGSRAFVATSTFRTTSGREVGLHGVEPDVTVELDWDQVTEEQDPVRDLALNLLLTGNDE